MYDYKDSCSCLFLAAFKLVENEILKGKRDTKLKKKILFELLILSKKEAVLAVTFLSV
jgi:hypothetical protein